MICWSTATDTSVAIGVVVMLLCSVYWRCCIRNSLSNCRAVVVQYSDNFRRGRAAHLDTPVVGRKTAATVIAMVAYVFICFMTILLYRCQKQVTSKTCMQLITSGFRGGRAGSSPPLGDGPTYAVSDGVGPSPKRRASLKPCHTGDYSLRPPQTATLRYSVVGPTLRYNKSTTNRSNGVCAYSHRFRRLQHSPVWTRLRCTPA